MSRIIAVYYDLSFGVHRNTNGNVISKDEYPRISYKEQPLVQLHLVTDASLTVYTGLGDSSDVYSVAIDSDFDHSTDVMCKTVDADINKVGDWGQADASQGRFSIRLDATTAAYASKIGTVSEKKKTMLELLAYDGSVSGDLVFAVQMLFRCFNAIDDGGAVPT